MFKLGLPVVEQVVEVSSYYDSGKWVTREDRLNEINYSPSSVLINLIRNGLDVYAQHVQRHALVRDAPPAEGCTKGLYHLNLFVVRDDQSTAISFQVSLARSVPWEVHMLRQLGFAQQSDVDFEVGEAVVE